MSVKFEIDYEDVRKLEAKFEKIPDKVEERLNEIIHGYGAVAVKEDITSRLPVSKVNKRHAKNSKPLKNKDFNLGFEVLPKRPYNYLVFPDQALGTSHGKTPEEFMVKGLNDSTRRIMDEINNKIDQLIKEEI